MSGRAAQFASAALLSLMGLLAWSAAKRESITYDEIPHIGAGVSYWQKLDLRMNPEHPPLAKMIAALPLAISGVHADYSDVSWTMSERFFPEYAGQLLFGDHLRKDWNQLERVLTLSRLPMVILMMIAGFVLFQMGSLLAGDWGGLTCVAFFCASPIFLAHGPLVHTDVAFAMFGLLTVLTFARMLSEPSRPRVAAFALSLAGALLAKFVAMLLIPVVVIVAASLSWFPPPGGKREHVWRLVFSGLGGALFAVYLFYLIFSWNQPLNALSGLSQTTPSPLRRALMPPWLYSRGMFLVLLQAVRPTFLSGKAYSTGVWFYFPMLFWMKSTIGALVAFGIAAIGAIVLRVRGKKVVDTAAPTVPILWRTIWLTLGVYLGASLSSSLNIGFRHFVFPLALLIALTAPFAARLIRLARESRFARGALIAFAAAGVCGVVSTALAYPFYIPYRNALTSAHPAYYWFHDSNLDWGQSLTEANALQEQRNVPSVLVDAYGFTDTRVEIPRSENWDCHDPMSEQAGQWAIVSASRMVGEGNCAWMLGDHALELAGGSMYAFIVPSPLPAPGSGDRPDESPQGADAQEQSRELFLRLEAHPRDLPAFGDETQTTFEHWIEARFDHWPRFRDLVLGWARGAE